MTRADPRRLPLAIFLMNAGTSMCVCVSRVAPTAGISAAASSICLASRSSARARARAAAASGSSRTCAPDSRLSGSRYSSPRLSPQWRHCPPGQECPDASRPTTCPAVTDCPTRTDASTGSNVVRSSPWLTAPISV